MRTKNILEATAPGTIARYGMLEGGERVVVSVSGGPDSVALLLYLHGIAPSMGLDLHVFHLDHMLRGEESAADARFVEELSGGLGLPVRAVTVDVRGGAEQGRSPQDAARRVRMAALREYADEAGADRIATGHTADDQVETFLMRVVQGAGLTGLGGIRPVAGPLIRPLIEVWREEVEEYCERMGVTPRRDPSNLRGSYLRNHVRLSLVPFLAAEFGEGVREVILREVESLSLDRQFMVEASERAFEEVGLVSDGCVRLDADAFSSLPPAVKRGVIREAWWRLVPGEPSLGWRHVMDIMERVAGGQTGSRLDLPGVFVVEREYGDIVLKAAGESHEDGEGFTPVVLEVPGKVHVGDGRVIEARRVGREYVSFQSGPDVEFVRPDLEVPLEVRTVRPGDRFRPLGSPGTRKLKDFFIDVKFPRALRKGCPLVLSGGQVVWVAGWRLDERFCLGEDDREAVMLLMRRSD